MRLRMACATLEATLLLVGVGFGRNMRARPVATPSRQAGARESGAGDITGKVNFRGKPPQLHPLLMDADPICASEQPGKVLPEDGRVNANNTLPNAFVYISKGSGNLNMPAPKEMVTITQKGCRYEPHVLGIEVGQPLRVVTEDPTEHNIHISPRNGRHLNVSQKPGSDPVTTKFSNPQVMISVNCNLHPWMQAYIGVVTNPYFAVTGDDGVFAIRGVPSGDYTLAIWTATFGTQERQVSVRAGQTAIVDFIFVAK
jgi:plastocyanin